jgi:hypothetical protein
VDSLGLSIAAEKLEAISRLKFLKTLKQLDTYLRLTRWLRQYMPFYAAISGPLQDRKTLLLKGGPVAGPERKNYLLKTLLENPTPAEIESWKALQELLSDPT